MKYFFKCAREDFLKRYNHENAATLKAKYIVYFTLVTLTDNVTRFLIEQLSIISSQQIIRLVYVSY